MMRRTKRQLMLFSFYDFTGIQAHLERMAAKGWLLEKVNPWYWKYRRTEPQKVHYAVTYFPQASDFDPGPTEGQEVLQDYCAQAGWERVARSAQMQIFRSTAEEPVPIETDAAVQVENIHQAMKGSFLPSQVVLLCLALFQLGTHLWQLYKDPVSQLLKPTLLFTFPCWTIVLVLCLTELISYFRWHRRAEAAALLDGSLTATRGHRFLQQVFLAAVAAGLVLWLFSLGSRRQAAIAIGSLLTVTVLIVLVNLLKAVLKRCNVSAGANRAATIAACVIFSFALVFGLTAATLRLNRSGLLDDHPPAETYLYNGSTWEVYHDPLPLTLQDLTDTDYDGYSTALSREGSLLLSRTVCDQSPRMDALKEPDLRYEIVQSRFPFLCELVVNDYLKQAERYNSLLELAYAWRAEPAAAWDAAAAYRYYSGDEPLNAYLICWPDRVVKISFDWEPTPEQCAIAAAKLKTA